MAQDAATIFGRLAVSLDGHEQADAERASIRASLRAIVVSSTSSRRAARVNDPVRLIVATILRSSQFIAAFPFASSADTYGAPAAGRDLELELSDETNCPVDMAWAAVRP
nr:hypothetical protein [uncultured Paracoccus sp.]